MGENGKKSWLGQNWLPLTTVLLLLVLSLQQSIEIQSLKNQMYDRINDLEQSVHTSVSNISNQVTYGIEEANHPLESYDLHLTGLEPAEKALLADVSVTLRRWAADTKATLLMTLGNETRELPMEPAGNGGYAARLALPLENSQMGLNLALTVEQDGIFTRQDLGGWEDVSMLLPYRASGWGGSGWGGRVEEAHRSGVLTLPADIMFDIQDTEYRSVQVNDPAFRVYRNGEVVWEQAASLEPNLAQDRYYSYYLGDTAYFMDAEAAPPEAVEIACQTGDEILVTFACTDDYGLCYEFTHTRLTITETGPEDSTDPVSDSHPRLSWTE